ncbi:MAG: winged helix-turn-helix transcriptional regulator [Neglectibacter timonensis]
MNCTCPMRFGELKKMLKPITNTALTNALKELEADDLIQRIQYNEMPLRVEYFLTEKVVTCCRSLPFPNGGEIYTMILTILTSIKIRLAEALALGQLPAFFYAFLPLRTSESKLIHEG